jgi:hypothetical protein
MKKIILCRFIFLINFSIFSQDREEIAELHFGLGTEFNAIGFGLSSVNSVVTKFGDFGAGGFFGINYGVFASEANATPIVWDVYLSYEYPGWFGGFFSFGKNHVGYLYDANYGGKLTATVDRPFLLFGLQKTFYASSTLSQGVFIPGSYIGHPSTWRSSQYWSPGTYHFSFNLQIGIRIDRVGNLSYNSFFSPINQDALISSVTADDNKIKFFLGGKANFDIPIRITKKGDDESA